MDEKLKKAVIDKMHQLVPDVVDPGGYLAQPKPSLGATGNPIITQTVLGIDPGVTPDVVLVGFHDSKIIGVRNIVGDEVLHPRDLNIEDCYPKHQFGWTHLFTTLIDGEPALMVETRWGNDPVRTVERFEPNPGDFTLNPVRLYPEELVYSRQWGSYGRYSAGVQSIKVNKRK